MQAVRSTVTLRRALPVAVLTLLAAAGTGFAQDDTGKPPPSASGSGNNGSLNASARGYSLTYPSGTPGSSARPLASVDVNWTPPPCWIGPIAGAKQFKADVLAGVAATNVPGQPSYALAAMDEYRRHYADGYTWSGSGSGYKDFNIAQDGKGAFWGAVENPDSTSPNRFDCNSTIPFWVPNGQLPPAGTPNVITPDMLSKLAYTHTHVPGVTIETNPKATQTVNLPTWVWLQERFAPVQVRASVDLGGGREIWAETTAKATSVRIDPGTPDATVFPSSGDCPIGADGRVGADYNGDPKADPPCGVTYQRSTQNRSPYQLNVTARWTVSWTGSSGGPFGLPDGVIDNPTPVTVQEIQSINR
jgi:enoyl reductase